MLRDFAVDRVNEKHFSYNWFTASVIEGNDLWFVPNRGAKLLHCNIENGVIDFCGNIPNESQLIYGNYAGMVKIDDYLILAPSMAKELAVYDISKGRFFKTYVDNPKKIGDKFVWGMSVGKSAFFIGYFYPAILEYNIEKKECQLYSFEHIKEIGRENSDIYYFEDSICLVKDSLMFPCYNSGYVMEFNILSKQYTMHSIGENIHLRTISYDGEYCWISIREREGFILWNPVTKEVDKTLLNNGGGQDKEMRFYHTCAIDNEVYILHCVSNAIYIGKSRKLERLKLGREMDEIEKRYYHQYDLKKMKFLFLYSTEDGRVYTYSARSNRVYIIDKQEVKSFEIKLPENIWNEFIDDYIKAKKQVGEEKDFFVPEENFAGGISGYLRFILRWNMINISERKKKAEAWRDVYEDNVGSLITEKILEGCD